MIFGRSISAFAPASSSWPQAARTLPSTTSLSASRRADAQARRKFGVGQRMIQLDRAVVFRHRLLDFAGAGQDSRVQEEGARRRVGIFHQVFQQHERMAVLALLKKGAGQAELHRRAVGGLRQALAKFFFGLRTPAVVQQGVGEQLAQGGIVGGSRKASRNA